MVFYITFIQCLEGKPLKTRWKNFSTSVSFDSFRICAHETTYATCSGETNANQTHTQKSRGIPLASVYTQSMHLIYDVYITIYNNMYYFFDDNNFIR